MQEKMRMKYFVRLLPLMGGIAAFLIFCTPGTAVAQTSGANHSAELAKAGGKSSMPADKPILTNYKSVKIGTTRDEVREKLGKPKIDDPDGFYYEISDNEFAQLRTDQDKKVRLISVTYSGENKNAPKMVDIFGSEIIAESKPDGSVYRLVRYPQAGYWVAYSRSAGEHPTVTVTMQKMAVRN